MEKFIQRSSLKVAVIAALVFVAAYVIINFSPIGTARLNEITGGAAIFDFEFGYDTEKAETMLGALGEEGRAFYLGTLIPLDFVFPVTYMLFYACVIALALKHLNMPWLGFFLFAPLANMIADWVENIGIISMLSSYPDVSGISVALASSAGVVKRVLIIFHIALFFVFVTLLVAQKYRRKHVS